MPFDLLKKNVRMSLRKKVPEDQAWRTPATLQKKDKHKFEVPPTVESSHQHLIPIANKLLVHTIRFTWKAMKGLISLAFHSAAAISRNARDQQERHSRK